MTQGFIKEGISVEYLDHMGSDLTVVNKARTSFDKQVDEFTSRDAGLIRYLATGFRTGEWRQMIQDVRHMNDYEIHELFLRLRRHATHWAPFAHPHVEVRIVAPVFVARQYMKHQIGMTWSEVSRRYVDSEPTYYYPDEWRSRPAKDIKQGSGTEAVTSLKGEDIFDKVDENIEQSNALYKAMIEEGVAPEMARSMLLQNMNVTWCWTGSLASFARVCQQRLDNDAQKEAQILAQMINGIMNGLFPASWEALVGECLGHYQDEGC